MAGISTDTPVKCAHEPCACNAPIGQAYCSDYCEHAATSGPPRREPVCECGHAPCGER
jgi:hypothetical protein